MSGEQHKVESAEVEAEHFRKDTLGGSYMDQFNPLDAARYLVTVALAAGRLLAAQSEPDFDMTLGMIELEQELFLD